MRITDCYFKSLNLGVVCFAIFLKQHTSTCRHSRGDLICFNGLKTFIHSEDSSIYISYVEFTRELLADISNWLPFGCLINISNLPCPKRISWFPPETYCCCSHHISVNGNSVLLVVQGKILGLSLSLYLFLSHPVYNPSTNSFDFNIYPNLTTCHLYHQSPGSIHHCLLHRLVQ